MTECYWCGRLIGYDEPWCMLNVAPDAASGGTMMPHHSACAPTLVDVVSAAGAPARVVVVPNPDRPPRRA